MLVNWSFCGNHGLMVETVNLVNLLVPGSTWKHGDKKKIGELTSHYNDVIMSAMASQITSLTSVYSTIYSGADQRKHQSTASLAYVRGIRWWLVVCCWVPGECIHIGLILGMDSANERAWYYVTPSLIGRAHTQNDPFILFRVSSMILGWL